MMSVSVVMTTFNGELYIEEQLKSILNQTFLPNEILIFDDRSTDKTTEIIKRIMDDNGDANIKLFVNKKNKGWRRNFIDAISEAKGKYVFLSDQDDIWEKNKIEVMVKAIDNNNSIGLLASNYSVMNLRGKKVFEEKQEKKMKNDGCISRYPFNKKFYLVARPGCTYCFRKELFDDSFAIWNSNLAHDKMLWVFANVFNCLYIINKKLITFRRHDRNATGFRKLSTKKQHRINNIDSDYEFVSAILNYDELNNSVHKKVLSDYLSYLSVRKKLITHFNIKYFIIIIFKFYKFLPSIKSLFKDCYISFKG